MAGQQVGRRHNHRRGNPQRRVLAEQITKGKTIAEAGRIAGYSCRQSASNALRSMRSELIEALEKNGWGPEAFVSKHLLPMLERKKRLYFATEGIVTDEREVEDTPAQLTAGDMYLKIVGGYAPLGVEHSGAVVHVLTEAEKREAAETIKRLLAYDSDAENPIEGEVEEEHLQ